VKILMHPVDRYGCGFHRMTEPARAVREQFGDEVQIDVRYSMDVIPDGAGGLDKVDLHGADVVVIQRPETWNWVPYLRLAQHQGAAVVIEIDDLLDAVPVGHAGLDEIRDGRLDELLRVCCREADLVTATTEPLLGVYARHGRGVVIPNAIHRRFAELPPAYERETVGPVSVGWTGAVNTHPYDLLELGSGLATALERTGGHGLFKVWSPRGVAEQTGVNALQLLNWERDPAKFLGLLGQQLDVGLAPLRDDLFNRSKSWLKPIEYAARGILPIHSGIAKYAAAGVGLPARRPRDWTRLITKAIEDPDWRREFAADAHAEVFARHLTEHTAERWVAAWRQAADARVRA
jgi:hypothetical protein